MVVYEPAKDRKDARLTDEFFLGCVEKIGKTIAKEDNRVRVGMGGALMSIGKRNRTLNAAAIRVANAIGPIHFSDGNRDCEPMDVLKHEDCRRLNIWTPGVNDHWKRPVSLWLVPVTRTHLASIAYSKEGQAGVRRRRAGAARLPRTRSWRRHYCLCAPHPVPQG